MISKLRDYLKLPPHKQFNNGLLAFVVYVLCSPVALVIVSIIINLDNVFSYRRDYSTVITLLIWAAYAMGTILFLLGVVLPILRMLGMSHKFSKQIGRGDEHLIFYIGLAILALTWLYGYKPYINSTYEQTLGATQIMFFYLGNIFGLGLIVTGLILLCRLSRRYSTTLANASPTEQ